MDMHSSLASSRNLAVSLTSELSARIQGGLFKPGEQLPSETAIMREQGVSRTVVREAISRLKALGLVETRYGIGTFVLGVPKAGGLCLEPLGDAPLRELLAALELRTCLEVEAAGLAAQRRTPQQLSNMRRFLDAQLADTSAQALEADYRFHLELLQATGNVYFIGILGQLGARVIPPSRLGLDARVADDPQRYLFGLVSEHEDIYQAIARRDAESARAAMRLHLSNGRERLRRFHSAEAS